jgi:hypothetical protein
VFGQALREPDEFDGFGVVEATFLRCDEPVRSTSRFFQTDPQSAHMSLTTDDFRDFLDTDPEDDETVSLGDALAELAVDVEVDSVEAVRDIRERT